MDYELNLEANNRRLGFEQPRTSTILPVPPNRRHGFELSPSSHRESTDTNRLKKWWCLTLINIIVRVQTLWPIVSILLCFYSFIRPIMLQIMTNVRNPVYMLTSRQCPRICGNADTYGIGIRIATYLQMLLTTLVYRLSPKHSSALDSTNLWLVFALSVAFSTMAIRETSIIDARVLKLLGDGVVTFALFFPIMDSFFWYNNPVSSRWRHETALTNLMRYCVMILWACSILYSEWPTSSNQSQLQYGDGECRLSTVQPGCEPVMYHCLAGVVTLSREYGLPKLSDILLILALLLVLFISQFWYLGIILWYVLLLDREGFNAKLSRARDSEPTYDHEEQGSDIFLLRKSQIIFDCLCVWSFWDFRVFFKTFDKGPAQGRPGPVSNRPPPLFPTHNLAQEPIDRCSLFLLTQYRIPLERLPPNVRDQIKNLSDRALQDVDEAATARRTSEFPWFLFHTLILCGTIIQVELTIKLNNIRNVNDLGSMGQLIAFIVGLGGYMTMGMNLITHKRKEKYGAPLYEVGRLRERG